MDIDFADPQVLVWLDASICQDSLYEFVKSAWSVVEPSEPFIDNWHIQTMCEYLSICAKGDMRRLIINIPPRHMKSLMVNVFFPAWVWTFWPEAKFLFSSYAEELAIRDSVQCRLLITSEWYQERWSVILSTDQNQKSKFYNTQSGYRISVGVGGGATGEGGDFVVCDDPIKITDANSELVRTSVNIWWDNTISTRLNNPKTGRKILIMQRLHEDDLTGHLLQGKETYEHLCLPAEYEGVRFHSSIGFVDPRINEGELLWPERFGKDEIASLKNSLSPVGIAGQLQQRPSPASGFIYKKDWFLNRSRQKDFIAVYHSWDTASSISEGAAYSSCVVGGLLPDYRLVIVEVFRDKLEFPQLRQKIEDMAGKYAPLLKGIVIESKSSGLSVMQSLSQASGSNISELLHPFNPTSDKITRGMNASLWCANGSVLLPPPSEENIWLYDFTDELFTFPNSKYKDQVDSFNQLILWTENFLAEGLRARQPVTVEQLREQHVTMGDAL